MIAIAFVLGLGLGWALCLHEQAAARMRPPRVTLDTNVVPLRPRRSA